jgi:hypothetical protein
VGGIIKTLSITQEAVVDYCEFLTARSMQGIQDIKFTGTPYRLYLMGDAIGYWVIMSSSISAPDCSEAYVAYDRNYDYVGTTRMEMTVSFSSYGSLMMITGEDLEKIIPWFRTISWVNPFMKGR